MHFTNLLPLALGAAALPQAPHYGDQPHAAPKSVAYFLENNPAGSSIVSLHIAPDGKLSHPMRTSTGGSGSIAVNSSNLPVAADSLGSQGSVTIAHNMIFTVNAGSNTVSMFMIDPKTPYRPKLVGQPVSTQGDFPISVTYSKKLNKACVLNGGAMAGVTCYSVHREQGLMIDGPLRKLASSVIDETTPANGPPGSAAQVLFNPSSTALFATIKSGKTTSGGIVAWSVMHGKIGTSNPVVNVVDGTKADFGFQFTSSNTIFLADPSFGAALLTVNPDLTISSIAHTVVPGQVAICWTQSALALGDLYTIDAGKNSIYKLNPKTGAIKGVINVHTPGGNATEGLFDSAIKSQKLYSLTATNGIVVVDLKSEKQVQYLDLEKFGARQFYQGMAVWP